MGNCFRHFVSACDIIITFLSGTSDKRKQLNQDVFYMSWYFWKIQIINKTIWGKFHNLIDSKEAKSLISTAVEDLKDDLIVYVEHLKHLRRNETKIY